MREGVEGAAQECSSPPQEGPRYYGDKATFLSRGRMGVSLRPFDNKYRERFSSTSVLKARALIYVAKLSDIIDIFVINIYVYVFFFNRVNIRV